MASPGESVNDIFWPGGPIRLDLLTQSAATALKEALRLAHETRWDCLRSPHVFMGLLAVPDPCVNNWGRRLRADLPRLLEQFQELFYQEDGDPDPFLRLHREFLSDNVIRLLREAYQRTRNNGRPCTTPMDLLISLLTADNSIVAECFERIGIPATTLARLAVMAERQPPGDDNFQEPNFS
jgi:ATP-dependent Clp protease ATP-binding subunit ClpA